MKRVHSFTDDALGELDAVGVVEALRRGDVSVPEVVDAAIARTEHVDPEVNAVAYRSYERARAEARHPRGGYFSGVPTFVKDNVDVAGMPSQEGCDAFVSPPRRFDGDFARMFHALGPITLGKSQLSEFGFSAVAEHPRLGAVRSPWNILHPAGASSAGAGALVAAGAVPLAHANDGGGSIRIPAAVNGLVGLKPTRGRIAQDKLMRDLPVQVVVDGVLTRSVRDTAAFLREAERVYRHRRLPEIGDVTGPGRRRLRIAVVTEGIGRASTPEVAARTLETAALLEDLGHRVDEIATPVPDSMADDFLLYWCFLAAAVVRQGRRTYGEAWDDARLDNLTLGLADQFRRRSARLPLALTRLAASGRRHRRWFAGYDAVLSPTLATATPALGHLDPTQDFDVVIERLLAWVAFTPLANATGEPSISLPLARSASGLPLGMMLGAPAGHDRTLVELAFELEQARPWARIQDPIGDFASAEGAVYRSASLPL